MKVATILLSMLAVLLSACVSVDVGNSESAQARYVLTDAGPAGGSATASPRSAPVADSLMINGAAGDPLAETASIAYSRRSGERSAYQLSTWTERPARRILQLLQKRLESRGSFATVAMLGEPVNAELMLTVTVVEIYHDVAQEPGQARLVLQAALYSRNERKLIAKGSFSAAPAVAEPRAAAAAAAMSQAVAETFDQLVPWLEQQAARAPSAPKR